jgi:uncharacterized membrane protein YoaK (UPF0700 family)
VSEVQSQRTTTADYDELKNPGVELVTLKAQTIFALVLTLVSGYVDAYGYMKYKLYGSFMSGNSTQTGLQTGQGNWEQAGHNFLPIMAFVLGVFLGTLMLHSGLRWATRSLLFVSAFLLTLTFIIAYANVVSSWLAIVLLSVAMGMTNTTVSRVGTQSVSLGYVTGGLNNLAQHIALAIKRLPVPQAKGLWDTHGFRIALLSGIWLAFVMGALLSSALAPSLGTAALLPPIFILYTIAVFYQPIRASSKI